MTDSTQTAFAIHARYLEKVQHEIEIWATGVEHIAGVDEAGRGPLAGPVVAAAVILEKAAMAEIPVTIDDSKKLSARQRETAYQWIVKNVAAYAVGIVDVDEIDRINIRQAAMAAMRKAVLGLDITPGHLLVDGTPLENPPYRHTAIIGGDGKSLSIGAASIIAKVIRDQIMLAYHHEYPVYEFAQNKGYPTAKHLEAIVRHGLCPIHRRSFHPKKLRRNPGGAPW